MTTKTEPPPRKLTVTNRRLIMAQAYLRNEKMWVTAAELAAMGLAGGPYLTWRLAARLAKYGVVEIQGRKRAEKRFRFTHQGLHQLGFVPARKGDGNEQKRPRRRTASPEAEGGPERGGEVRPTVELGAEVGGQLPDPDQPADGG
jgi:hypothetical protein